MHSCANFARIQIDLNGGDTKGFYNSLAIAYDFLSRDIYRMDDLSKDQRESVLDLRDRVGGLMNSISRCASTFVEPIMESVSRPVPYKTWSWKLVDFEDKE